MTDASQQLNAPSQKPIFAKVMRGVQDRWRTIVIAIPYFWLLLFFLAPFFIVAKISVAELAIASPPFTQMVEWVDGGIITIRLI